MNYERVGFLPVCYESWCLASFKYLTHLSSVILDMVVPGGFSYRVELYQRIGDVDAMHEHVIAATGLLF